MGTRDRFLEEGYIGPVRVLSPEQCRRFLLVVGEASRRPPLDWAKGRAVTSRAFYEIAVHPTIVEGVVALLGEDVVLWGASIQRRSPGAVHPWHCDIESSDHPGKTLAVWIGLEHTSRESSLLIIPYSHRFGLTVQQLRHQLGKRHDQLTKEDLVNLAQLRDERSRLVTFDMTDGEALFFDGNLWHGSHNVFGKTRQALLLQYATPDAAIRIPDLNSRDWPFHFLDVPRPACLMVSGTAKPDVNRIVPAPLSGDADWRRPQVTSRVYPLALPLPPDEENGWKPYPVFRGATGDVRDLSCHVSTLRQHRSPHPPHTHKEEELLFVLTGEVDLTLPDLAAVGGDVRRRLKAGQLVYYPAHFAHTLETVSEAPANYLMFKWHTEAAQTDSTLAFAQFDVFDPARSGDVEEGYRKRPVFQGPTAYLRKLHCHTTTLTPGAGYAPHVDAYDVAIIVLEGEVETIGQHVGPHGMIFYPAGESHGMRNPGDTIARYVVFEFHGSRSALKAALPKPPPPLLARLTDRRRWRMALSRLAKRLGQRVRI